MQSFSFSTHGLSCSLSDPPQKKRVQDRHSEIDCRKRDNLTLAFSWQVRAGHPIGNAAFFWHRSSNLSKVSSATGLVGSVISCACCLDESGMKALEMYAQPFTGVQKYAISLIWQKHFSRFASFWDLFICLNLSSVIRKSGFMYRLPALDKLYQRIRFLFPTFAVV